MIRTICSRTSSDYKRLTKHENEDAQWIIARSENVCDKPLETHLLIAQRVGVAQPDMVEPLMKSSESVGILLRRLIRRLATN